MSDELLNDVKINKIEMENKIEISENHKVNCVCCNGTKTFQNKTCPYCDDNGLIPIKKLNLFGIPIFLLN